MVFTSGDVKLFSKKMTAKAVGKFYEFHHPLHIGKYDHF